MEDKSDKKSRREKRAEEERKAKDRARGDRNRDARPSGGGRDRNRDRDREAKSRARRSSGSAAAPGVVAERNRDDDRVSRKSRRESNSSRRDSYSSSRRSSSNRGMSGSNRSISSRTSDRDEKSRERARRSGSRKALPGAVAARDDDVSMMSQRERSRRRKESQASGSSRSLGSRRDSGRDSHRERIRREKEQGASRNDAPAPPTSNKDVEEVPTANAIDVETMQFEATTVPNTRDLTQLEAARQAKREETQTERDRSQKEQKGEGDETETEEDSTQRDNKAKKYVCAAIIIVAIAAGIVWWVVFRGKSDPPQVGPTAFKPPTEDDCSAVSQGLAVPGQKEDSVRTYAVEMNFAVSPDMDLALLKSELEIRTQRSVLPLLIGCQVDGPITIENNSFVIANANLELLTMDSPKSCNLGSKSLCSFTYMELDLFLNDPEVSSDYILDLIAFVFRHKSLLEVLDLLTPIETIDTQREYEVLALPEPVPSSLPSSSPSSTVTEPPVDLVPDENCLNIAEGKSVDGQEDLVLQEYDVYMDVMLSVAMNDLTTVTSELEDHLQRFLMPALVGCDPSVVVKSNENRRLATKDYVENAGVKVEYLTGGECLPESDSLCYRYVSHLDIYVRTIFGSADLTTQVMEKFREEPLVPRVGLQSPFVRITVVDAVAQTPSAMPSFSQSASPTTQAPLRVPSEVPSASPSQVQSLNPSPPPTPRPTDQTSSPTRGPTKFPTRSPTRGPTKFPTRSPTKFPTPRPTTKSPTKSPTPPPTVATPNPSSSPTRTCFQSNNDLRDAVTVYAPTPAPSVTKNAVEDQYGRIADWCFGPGVTSMASLFQEFFNFNEDITKWDVSGITDMSNMFKITYDFNQDLSSWNVSSVTNMQYMFNSALAFNQDIGGWVVSSVTDMQFMFSGAEKFNRNIGNWDVSSVTNMKYMFAAARVFNQDISQWDVSKVTDMSGMFQSAYVFNANIADWDVSKVTNMVIMFYEASNFNANIGGWDVSKVTNMGQLFDSARSFNQDLKDWDVSSVSSMMWIFHDAAAFNRNLCDWGSRLSSSTSFNQASFDGSGCLEKGTPVFSASPVSPICHSCP